MPSNHLILCHPLLLPPSVFPRIKFFSSESVLRFRWPKYWSFSFSISPSNEYSRWISFRIDCLISLQSKGLSRVFSLKTPQFKSISPSNEYSRWISFRIDCLISLQSKGLSRVFSWRHHNSKALVPWRSPFFVVQLSHLNMTAGKTIALTLWTFFGKVTSLLFNSV